MNNIRRVLTYFCRTAPLLSVAFLTPAWGTPSPFELDLKELDRHRPPVTEKQDTVRQPAKRPAKSPPGKVTAKQMETDTRLTRYTVKEGDHVFRILMREFGLSNDEAERLLPTVARINGLANVRKLSVGQVLLLPTGKPATKMMARRNKPAGVKGSSSAQIKTARPEGDASVAFPPEPEPAEQDTPAEDETPAYTDAPVEPEAPVVAPPPAVVEAPVAPESPAIAAEPEQIRQADVPAPPLPRYPVRVLPITGTNSEAIVDSLTKALGLVADKKRIVDLRGAAAGNAFSIKVDRYIEEGGRRIIINCTDKDQFNYTLLRLLEQEGYRVIHAERGDFRSITGSFLAHLNKVHEFTARQVEANTGEGKKELAGFLVGDGLNDVQLFLHEPDGNDDYGR